MAEEQTDDAINRVLAREQEACEAVERCREKARAVLNAARGKARRIVERADERIAHIRARTDLSVERFLAPLRAEAQAYDGAPPVSEADTARLDRLAHRVAEQLTGGSK